MCDLPGLFVHTEEGWCRLQWSSSRLYVSSSGGVRPVRPVALGRRDARLLSARKVLAALKAFCSGNSSSIHLGAPLPLQASGCNVPPPPPAAPPIAPPAAPPAAPPVRTVSCGVQTEMSEERSASPASPASPAPPHPRQYVELVIDEEVVRLFRQWLSRSRTNCWNIDVRKFDTDEKYKEEIFYTINPAIELSRCPTIRHMLDRKQLRTVVTDGGANDEMTVQQFAKKLGLKSAGGGGGGGRGGAPSRPLVSSDSDDSVFDSAPARLRKRSARRSRVTKPSGRNSDIENRHPSHIKLTRSKLTGHSQAAVRTNSHKSTVKPYSSPLKNKSPVKSNANTVRSLSNSSESSSERPTRTRPNQSPNKSDSRSRPNQSPVKSTKNNRRSLSSSSTTSMEQAKTNTKSQKGEKIAKPRSRSRTRSRSPIRLRTSGNTSLERRKQTNNKQDNNRLNTSPNKTSKQVNKPRESRSRYRSPIRLRKSLTNKSNEPPPKPKSPVKSASGSQRSVKSASSGDGAKKTQSDEGPMNGNKASTIGASWKMPRYLYRKSCVKPGREYSSFEDQALVAWLSADDSRARRVNGNQLWRTLEADWPQIGGVKRSWHSLRNRYLRYVLPSLGGLALPQAQAGRLRAAAATGVIKGKGANKQSRKESPPLSAYAGVARARLRAVADTTTAAPTRTSLRSAPPAPLVPPVPPVPPAPLAPTSTTSRSPNKSPTYASLTRRFALRPSNSPQNEKGSPTRHTRRLYNPRPL